ncbi:MAG TPA: phosphate signaling complex protein PhoU [Pseudonocardia sp.]|nr:phosphate signaling complex protein PhoU [Pseudonocardia sp.]
MRDEFQGELRQLGDDLAAMCRRAAAAMERALHALLEADLAAAEQVITDVDLIHLAAVSCDEHASNLLALQSPVARDLRLVVSAIRMSEKIGRMGDLARHVAEIARRRHPQTAIPADLNSRFAAMGQHAIAIAHTTERAITMPSTVNADEFEREDDQIDQLQRELLELVCARDAGYSVQVGVDVSLLVRFVERFADQAVGVTRQLDFVATGQLPHRPSATKPDQAPELR